MKKLLTKPQTTSMEDNPTPEWIQSQLDQGRILVMSDIPFDNPDTAQKFVNMGLKVSMEWTKNVHVGLLYKNPDTGEVNSSNFVFLAIPKGFDYAELKIDEVQDYPSYVNTIRGFDTKTIQDAEAIHSHNLKIKVLPESCTGQALHQVDQEFDAFVEKQSDALRGKYSNEVFNCQVFTQYLLSKAFPDLEGNYFPSQVDPLTPGEKNDFESRMAKLPLLEAYFSEMK